MRSITIFKNIAAVGFADAISRSFFFLFNVIVARSIAPTEFGIYGLAISLGVWLWAVANAGLSGHGTRLLAQGADLSKTVSAVLIARLPVLATLFVLLAAILLVLPLSFNERLIYATAFIYVLGMSLFPAWIALARHANREYLMAYGLVSLFGLISLLLFTSGSVEKNSLTASVARTLPWLIGSAVALYLISKRLGFVIQWTPHKGLLKRAAPLGIAANIYKLVPLIPFITLRILTAERELSAFSAMMQVQTILLAGSQVFSSVLMPSYAKQLANTTKDNSLGFLGRYFLLFIPIVLVVSLGYIGFGSYFIPAIFGRGFGHVKKYILPFGLAFMFSSLRFSFDSMLIASNEYFWMVVTGAVIMMFSIVLCYLAAKNMFLFAWVVPVTEFLFMILNGKIAFSKRRGN